EVWYSCIESRACLPEDIGGSSSEFRRLEALAMATRNQKVAEGPPEMGDLDEDLLRGILAHLRVRTGHDFSKYKRSTVVRRITHRMQVNGINVLKDYYDIIRDTPDEAQALLSDFLISVTAFFRDQEAFEVFAKLLPGVFKDREQGQ